MASYAGRADLDNDTFPTVYLHVNSSFGMDNTTEANFGGSSQSRHVADALFDKNIRLITMYVIIVLGLLGGLLVLLWIHHNRRRKSRVNALILNVAVSDLVVICAACVTQVIWEHFERRWYAGNVICKLIKWIQGFSMMASTNQLVVLSLDRMQAILSPLRRPMEVWKMASIGWITAAVLSTPQLYIFSTNFVTDERSPFFNFTVCESIFRNVSLAHRQAYLTYIGLMVFYIPLIIISICYIAIFLKIAQKANRENSKGGRGSSHQRPGKVQLTSTVNNSLPKAKIKTLKMTIVVILSFILCSLPYHVLEMIYSYGNHENVPSTLATVFGSMAVANSATNPFVFLLFNMSTQCIKGVFTTTNTKRTYFESMNSTRMDYALHTTQTDMTDGTGKFDRYLPGSRIEMQKAPKKDATYVRVSNSDKPTEEANKQ